MARIKLDPVELKEHQNRKVRRLMKACTRFDEGEEDAIEDISTILRMLLHKSKNSKPLLDQTGSLSEYRFLDSSQPIEAQSISAYYGLAAVGIRKDGTAFYHAPLEMFQNERWLAFEEWWHSTVFKRQDGKEYSRCSVVITMANQDGGAHVDAALDEDYHRLTRQNAMGVFAADNSGASTPLGGPHFATVRQIAHEVLRTLDPTYRCDYKPAMDFSLGSVSLQLIAVDDEHPSSEGSIVTPPIIPEFRLEVWPSMDLSTLPLPRNSQCPCGSGTRFKHCHGRFGDGAFHGTTPQRDGEAPD